MRRLVAAIVVLSLALALTGCGGGGAEPTSSTAAPASATSNAGGSGTTMLPDIANRSANETSTFLPFPKGASVPADLRQKVVVDKQPTLIYFYDSTQQVSKEVRVTIDAVRSENRGLVDLVAYDIGKYATVNSAGTISISPQFAKDPSAVSAVELARDPAIGVTFTPFIVLTDGQGYIIYKNQGLIDYAFLEREVQRAAR
jgi:hypothetical protein